MDSSYNNQGLGTILRRSICAGLAIAITGLALQGVVGFAAASYDTASVGLAAQQRARSVMPVVAHAGVADATRGFVSRVGRHAASSIKVVLAR